MPQRLLMEIDPVSNLDNDPDPHKVILSYQFSLSDVYAYDFLTTPDLTQEGSDLSACTELTAFTTSERQDLFNDKKDVAIPGDPFDDVPDREYPTSRNMFTEALYQPTTAGMALLINMDTMIAATALRVSTTVATANPSDFPPFAAGGLMVVTA